MKKLICYYFIKVMFSFVPCDDSSSNGSTDNLTEEPTEPTCSMNRVDNHIYVGEKSR